MLNHYEYSIFSFSWNWWPQEAAWRLIVALIDEFYIALARPLAKKELRINKFISERKKNLWSPSYLSPVQTPEADHIRTPDACRQTVNLAAVSKDVFCVHMSLLGALKPV